jgi:hypothetical protein
MLIRSPDFAALGHVSHAFFTREGGVSTGLYASLNGGFGSGDERAAVLENRARMAAEIGVTPDSMVSVHQVHSPDVVHVTAPFDGERPKADAMVTTTPGLALAVLTADCGPILFADAEARVIGAAHSGWKGSFTGIGEAVLGAMERLGAKRERVTAVLGPTIGPNAYEVGPEFVTRFLDADKGHARFFRPSERDGHAMFDLPAFIGAGLIGAGVGRFIDLALCTYADPARFYSYRMTTHRKEADYGRLVSAIALKA